MPHIAVIHAPREKALGNKIEAALMRSGQAAFRLEAERALSASLARKMDATIVIWPAAEADAAALAAPARDAFESGALIPVSVAGAPAPSGFEDLQPVDLTGWGGDEADPRWRFVLDEIILAGERARIAAHQAPLDAEPPLQQAASAPKAPRVKPPRARQGRRKPDAPGRRAGAHLRPLHVALGGVAGLVVLAAAGAFLAPSILSRGPGPYAPPLAHLPASEAPDSLSLSVVQPAAPESDTAETESAAPALREAGASADFELTVYRQGASEDNGEEAASDASVEDDSAARALPEGAFRDCPTCPPMATLPAGAFEMGTPFNEPARAAQENPLIRVKIEQPFAIGLTEVTFDQWGQCVADGGCGGYRPYDMGWGRADRPVLNVSWRDAQNYADWLTQKTGESYRLPSEAEWEYAARAGAATPFSFGAVVSADQANFNATYPYGGEAGQYRAKTLPAGSFKANPFGLFDMHGNLWEWTADCWAAPGAAPVQSPCQTGVIKGGAYNSGGWRLRAGHRLFKSRTARESDIGFRVVRDLD